jgi:hypothetical protein
MACAAEHATFNFFAVIAATAAVQQQEGRPVDGGAAFAIGTAAACLPSLPDYFEPAVHPNHRRIFHSVTFAIAVTYAIRQAYKWETKEPWEQVARLAVLTGGAAYLAHLVRDAFTAKSLPLI